MLVPSANDRALILHLVHDVTKGVVELVVLVQIGIVIKVLLDALRL